MRTIAKNTHRFTNPVLVGMLLTLVSGCIYIHDSDGYSSADLQSVTNRVLQGEIPAGIKSVEIENRFGSIRVVASEREPAQWSWKLTVQARTTTAAQEWANAANCTAVQDGSRLQLTVSLPDNSGQRRIQSDLEIRVPKSASVRTRNQFGRTSISGVGGDVDATGQNGSIELRDLGGKVRAQTSFSSLSLAGAGAAWLKNQNGSIEASHLAGELEAQTSFASLTARDIAGKVKARNQNGKIEVIGAKGDADLKTSFAELHAEAIQGDARLENQNGRVSARGISGAVKANTSFANMEIESAGLNLSCRNQNGSIRIRATSPELDTLDAETSFSSIEVRLPAGLKPAIQARTSFAEVESDYPVLMKPRGQDAFAEVEAGVPRVKLQNQNGRIRVVREKAVVER
jgi:hypothetical protein